jgi:hypothetical protein
MAANPIDSALVCAYRNTAFEVDHPQRHFAIRIGKRCEPLDALLRQHGQRQWAYVTACNPYSVRLAAADNARRQSALQAYLREAGFVIYPGRGVPAEPGWQSEDSFLVLGITREQALRVGAMFEQNAIVAGEAGCAAELLLCRR